MLRVAFRSVKPDKVEELRAWLAELDGPRRAEAVETLRDEGTTHEQAFVVDGADGPILVWATESEDVEQALAVYGQSSRPIDEAHRSVMSEVLSGKLDPEPLLDLRVPNG